jgi:hypothetical protein
LFLGLKNLYGQYLLLASSLLTSIIRLLCDLNKIQAAHL